MPSFGHPTRTIVAVIGVGICLVAGQPGAPLSAVEASGGSVSAPAASAIGNQRALVGTAGKVRQADQADAAAGTRYANGSVVVEQRFLAKTVEKEMGYRLFLPPGYAYERRDYPVLYMLHGVAGGSTEWEELGLLEATDRLIGSGEIDPLLIVLPDGGPNYWANHADGARWGDYVVEDVVPLVDRLYRTRPDREARAVGGLSMGGEGALRLALLNPDVFGIAAAHAPSLRTSYGQLSEDLQNLYGEPDRWRSLSPYWLVKDGDAAERLTLSIDIGEDDPWLENAEAFHSRLTAYGIEHQFAVLAGEHDASYWEAHRDRFLRFYSGAFARAALAE